MPLFRGSFRTRTASSAISFRCFFELFFLLMFLLAIPSLRGQVCTPSIRAGGGVAGSFTGPSAYVKGNDGHLWANAANGTSRSWTDLGMPGGQSVLSVVGAYSNGSYVYIFVQSRQLGQLWINKWDGISSAGQWQNQHTPAKDTAVIAGVGVVPPLSNNKAYALIVGGDNRLSALSYDGTKGSWTSLGSPPGKTVMTGAGVLTTSTNMINVYVEANDANLYMIPWDGTNSPGSWVPLGAPAPGIASAIGVLLDTATGNKYIYVLGRDGNLWRLLQGMSWSILESPNNEPFVAGIGLSQASMSAFLQGSDGHLWEYRGIWLDHDRPGGHQVSSGVGLKTVTVSSGVGVATVNNPGSPYPYDVYSFVLGSDGFLWMNGPSEKSWADLSTLLVNMTPWSLSNETNEDSEPFLSVDPSNPKIMVGSAFTPNPDGPTSSTAPVYVSNNCGITWSLNNLLQSSGSDGTGDITHAYSGNSGNFYAGILKIPPNADSTTTLVELKTPDPDGSNNVTIQNSTNEADQPFVQATTVGGNEHIYVGNNDHNVTPQTATVDVSLDGGATYTAVRIDPRSTTDPQDGSSVRVSIALDNTIYAAYFEWTAFTGTEETGTATANVVVVRNDPSATGTPFTSLTGPGGLSGVFVATDVQIPVTKNTGPLGQQRVGDSLSIAVDPNNSSTVYVAWADKVGNGIYNIHVRSSINKGVTWSAADLRTITNATNPSLAVAGNGTLGFLYQQVTNGNWVTQIEQTTNGFTTWIDTILSTVPANTPPVVRQPYLGDYNFLLAVGNEFRGVFSANNTPDPANFPQGVLYQRTVNFNTHTLLDQNGNAVAVSIDPFFFSVPVLQLNAPKLPGR